ncbi:MAG: ferredoxin--NADP reductase [Acidimicrobiales bacterium]
MVVTRSGPTPAAARDHGVHPLPVLRVITETADSRSFALGVPPDLADAYSYAAGQFCTVRVVIDGETFHRCYSMSSTPGIDDELTLTVKRVPGGAVSGWLIAHVEAGGFLDVSTPAGVFILAPDESELVACAAGSGITPVFSLLKGALHTTDRRVRLLYANRDDASVIFGAELDELAAAFPGRLEVLQHLDVDGGFVDEEVVASFLAGAADDVGLYLCGPTPFMDLVEAVAPTVGISPTRIHIERFTPADAAELVGGERAGSEQAAVTVTIELDGKTASAEHRAGTTILQTARQVGMSPPFSCESGSCATCMGRLVEGSVAMHVNNALTDDEVAEGWILTCQSVPTSAAVSVVYGFD